MTDWNARYREALPDYAPLPLLVETIATVAAGHALDLACGLSGNALYLAQNGWFVTAVDRSEVAIQLLQSEAAKRHLHLTISLINLEADYVIQPARWDLIIVTRYFQPNLLPFIKEGVKAGGTVITTALLQDPSSHTSPFRVAPGELRRHFADWEILHDHEGAAQKSPTHPWRLAEIVARRPA